MAHIPDLWGIETGLKAKHGRIAFSARGLVSKPNTEPG